MRDSILHASSDWSTIGATIVFGWPIALYNSLPKSFLDVDGGEGGVVVAKTVISMFCCCEFDKVANLLCELADIMDAV